MNTDLFIDGAWQTGAAEPVTHLDPSTGEVIWQGPSASSTQINDAFGAARMAFKGWAAIGAEARIEILKKYQTLIEHDAAELARLISQFTGKPLWEAKTEAAAVVGKIDHSINAYHQRTGENHSETANGASVLRHHPHGVMAVLGPYNFPAHLPNGHMVPALIAGNTVVFKPSELAAGPGAFLVARLHEAGVPAGVVNLVHGGGAVGQSMVAAPEVSGVLFTGGAKTGRAIHKALADRPEVIAALELGGNNPLIVWDVADLDAAAYGIIQSAFLTAGQRCTCARRLILPARSAGDQVLERLAAFTDKIIVDTPFAEPAPFMGPVISNNVAGALERAFDRFVDLDAEPIRYLSQRDEGTGFVSPGIVDVTKILPIADEEHFGPLLKVIRVDDFDAAIDVANNTKFGLSAGLFSDDPQKWTHFLNAARAGIINRNRQTTGASSAAPFGGVGHSGNHRPSAYYAADYCAYPVASQEGDALPPKPDAPTGFKA